MTLLLDTHVLIWMVEGTGDLAPRVRARMEAATTSRGLAVSAISFWEVAMLEQRRRIALARPVAEWRRLVIEAPGVRELAVTGEEALEAAGLPGDLHGDPADRILVATARLGRCTLVTRDERLLAYAKKGHVDALRA